MLGRILGPLERAVFHPESLPRGVVFGVAVAPAVAAGLWLYHWQAVAMLATALVAGAALHVSARLLKLPTGIGPVLPALVGVSLVGPGASPAWTAIVAVAAGALELLRASLVPSARNETGLLAYVLVYLTARSSLDRYLIPGSGRPLSEPIRLWLDFFSGSRGPIDPVRLYVGNVPGPVFATSLLAVIVGAAWFWYARRLSLVVLIGFSLGALLPIAVLGWNAGFQLDSGPTWYVVAFIVADRDRLPEAMAPRPLLGFAAGVATIGLRNRGLALEGTLLAVAALQLAVSLTEGSVWVFANRGAIWQGLRQARLRGPGELWQTKARRRPA